VQIKTLVAIKSCWPFKERRDACRQTWLPDLNWADYKFFVGKHAPRKPPKLFMPWGDPCESLYGEQDVLAFPVDDGFRNIAPKIMLLMRYALQNKYSQIVVVDDDVYLRPERLKEFVEKVQMQYDYVGWERTGDQHYMQGSCYYVSCLAAAALAVSARLVDGIPDDVAVGKALEGHYCWLHPDQFWPGAVPAPILASNNLISTHKCSSGHGPKSNLMHTIHDAWLKSKVQRVEHAVASTANVEYR
jgi:Galactosyltransferase